MFIMLIAYSFDTEYVSVPCETEEQAIKLMNDYLNKEIALVKEEQQYTPYVMEFDETEKVLVYDAQADGATEFFPDWSLNDYATYKVIEADHGGVPNRSYKVSGSIMDATPRTPAECADIFRELLEQDAVVGGKLWTTEDILSLIPDEEMEKLTAEEKDALISETINGIDTSVLNDCMDYEWDVIEDALKEALKKKEVHL